MVALLGLVAPGWRQRAPSASGSGSGQLQPWGPSTWVQLAVWLKASATLPPRAGTRRLGRRAAGTAAADAGDSSRRQPTGRAAGARVGSAQR
jgi:hypothetical protein